MEHDLNILMIFGIKEKLIILTAFVLQGHKYVMWPLTDYEHVNVLSYWN